MVLSSAIEKTDGGKGRVVEFAFTEEQQQLRRSVWEFAEGEIAPHVMEWDEASHFPIEIMPKLAEMGLLGVIFPEQYGGGRGRHHEKRVAGVKSGGGGRPGGCVV